MSARPDRVYGSGFSLATGLRAIYGLARILREADVS